MDGAPALCGLERLELRVENMQMAIATTTGRADIVSKRNGATSFRFSPFEDTVPNVDPSRDQSIDLTAGTRVIV